MFLIQNAYAADAAQQAPAGAGIMNLILLVAIFAIAYFMMIRPQQKRMKEHNKMVSMLGRGDEIITSAGIMGRIVALDEQAMDLEIAKGVVIRVQRNFVSQILPKGSLKASLGEGKTEKVEIAKENPKKAQD